MANWFDRFFHQDFHDWTIWRLNLQPYQHVLEVGYGSGRLLSAVAEKLKIGFLAGIESSIPLYQQAYRRNRIFIRRQLMQLHIGELYELPYPAHYFHTIYGSAGHALKDPGTECLRLALMLRHGGRLVWVSPPRRYNKAEDLRTEAARLQAACLSAGLTAIHTEYRDFSSGTGVAITGIKPDLLQGQAVSRDRIRQDGTINNLLLNPGPYFISNVARMQM